MSTAQRGGSGAVGPQQGGQRAASRPSAVRWGQLGAKPPPTDPTDPHQSVARPPPSPPRPSLPGAVAARSLFAKGVCCCPSRCQQGSQGTKRGTGRGAGTQTPNPPPKEIPRGCQRQHCTAVCSQPERLGGAVAANPAPRLSPSHGCPRAVRAAGWAAQELCTAGTASGGCECHRHRDHGATPRGLQWHAMAATMAQGAGWHSTVAHYRDLDGTGTMMAHHGDSDITHDGTEEPPPSPALPTPLPHLPTQCHPTSLLVTPRCAVVLRAPAMGPGPTPPHPPLPHTGSISCLHTDLPHRGVPSPPRSTAAPKISPCHRGAAHTHLRFPPILWVAHSWGGRGGG